MTDAITFEVREIDAWLEPDNTWSENTSYKLGVFTTRAVDCKKALTNYLRNRHGIRFFLNRTLMFDYGDMIEIVDRKTQMPIIRAIMIYNSATGKKYSR